MLYFVLIDFVLKELEITANSKTNEIFNIDFKSILENYEFLI